jgi:hypothetical protein
MGMGWEGDGQWGVDGDMQERMGRRGRSSSNSDGDSDKTTITTTTTTTSTSNRSTTTTAAAAASSSTRAPQLQQYTTALESSPASGVADRVYPQPQRPCTQASRLHSSAPRLRASHLTTASQQIRALPCVPRPNRLRGEGCSNGQPARCHDPPRASTSTRLRNPSPVADQGRDGVAKRADAATTGCGPDSDVTRQSRGWFAHSAQPEQRRVERGQTYGPGSSHQCTVRSGQCAGSGRVCEGVVDREPEPSQRAIRERPLLKRPCRGRADKGARLPR